MRNIKNFSSLQFFEVDDRKYCNILVVDTSALLSAADLTFLQSRAGAHSPVVYHLKLIYFLVSKSRDQQ